MTRRRLDLVTALLILAVFAVLGYGLFWPAVEPLFHHNL